MSASTGLAILLLVLCRNHAANAQRIRCPDEGIENASLPICLPKSYEQYLRPNSDGNTTVGLRVFVLDLEEIDDRERSMTFYMRISLSWMDERIVVIPKNFVVEEDNSTYLDPNVSSFLWRPDLFMVNLKRLQHLGIIREKHATLSVSRNGTLEYSLEFRVRVGCSFNHKNFPLDQQTCVVRYSGHNPQRVTYNGSFYYSPANQRLLPFDISMQELSDEGKFYTELDGDKQLSVCGFKVKTKRYIAPYVFRQYFPSSFIVFVSWISFLIGKRKVTGRLALLVSLSILQMNRVTYMSTNGPASASPTAVEVYGFTCLAFVTASLVEFAFVACNKKPQKFPWHLIEEGGPVVEDDLEGEQHRRKRKRNLKAMEKEEATGDDKSSKFWNRIKPYCDSCYLDLSALFFFPIAFILFNVVYWSVYLT